MAKTPFYTVLIKSSGRDISDLITDFTFEDCTDEDDMLKLTMQGKGVSVIDDPDFDEGVELVFNFGYIGGVSSGQRLAVITEAEGNYHKTIDLIISAMDKGRIMKGKSSKRIWKDFTSSQIVQNIARKYGLEVNVDDTKKVWKSIPQGNRTDFEFIKYLTTIEEKGKFIFYVSGDKLNFKKEEYDTASKRTFTYGDPDGVVVSFKTSFKKDKKTTGADAGVGVTDIDINDKSKINIYDQNSNPVKGLQVVKAGASPAKPAPTNTAPPQEVGKSILSPVDSQEEAEAVAGKAKKDAAFYGHVGTLITEGDPTLEANGVITMAGVAKKHSGNWHIYKITHKISKGGYINTFETRRDADTKLAGNTTIGPNENDNKVKLNIYDQNSNPVKNRGVAK